MTISAISRRAILALGLILAVPMMAVPAAANPAEQFVGANIQKGLSILNNKSLSVEQRRVQFEQFITALTDMKRIAVFTLGRYRQGASEADQNAFAAAFQNYAVAVYQSYFAKYAGQTLTLKGSTERAPNDFIVTTALIDPNDRSGQQPLQVDFRVRTEGGKPVVVDFSVAGIWLALEQRDQFTAFLGQNGGNIRTLIAHLNNLAKQYR